MSPLLSLKALPRATPTPLVVVWGYRWLIFRIMLGAVSGSICTMFLFSHHYSHKSFTVPSLDFFLFFSLVALFHLLVVLLLIFLFLGEILSCLLIFRD